MNVFIAVASRHHSTREIAEVLGQELRAHGHKVDVCAAEDVKTIAGYDAAVLGSAVYMGSWLPAARKLVEDNRSAWESIPVWLFSSGPLEQEDAKPPADLRHLDDLLQATRARGHKIFVGKLDRHKLGPGERLVSKLVHAPEGDFRDWEAIRAWAREINDAVEVPARPVAGVDEIIGNLDSTLVHHMTGSP